MSNTTHTSAIEIIKHGIIELRAKGLRTRETVGVGWLYQHAVKSRVFRERLEKKALRQARR